MGKIRFLFVTLAIILTLTGNTNGKAGKSSSYSRGSSSRSSSGGGWFGSSKPSSSYSRPSPSYSYSRPSPSPSYSRPSPSPSYGWNFGGSSNTASKPSTSYGWNIGSSSSNTASKPSSSYGWNTGGSSSSASKPSTSYGWNIGGSSSNTAPKPSTTNTGWTNPKPSAPVGPPPSYPGLQNKPVPSYNAPPAYSPSSYNPPAYKPSYSPSYSPSYNSRPSYSNPSYNSRPSYSSSSYNNRPSYSSPSHNSGHSSYSNPSYITPRQNTYNTYTSNPGYMPNYYGNTFGNQGLPGNTYISNNYYGNKRSGGSGFLTNALFFGGGMGTGYLLGRSSSYDSNRHYYNNRRWDEEEDRRWRATTQGPYFENKVPGEEKILPASAVIGAATAFGLVSLLPLNVPANKPLMYCNNTDLMQAPIRINNGNVYHCINNTIESSCLFRPTNEALNGTEYECVNKTMQCDLEDEEDSENFYCTNGTFLSKTFVFCNSTIVLDLANLNETAKILNCYDGQLPEHQVAFIPTTTPEPTTTTQKPLSFKAKAHVFFLKLIGKGDSLTTTTPIPETPPADTWVPEALTIPPETTEQPFVWMEKKFDKSNNETFVLEPVPEMALQIYNDANKFVKDRGAEEMTVPPTWTKVYITTTPMVPSNETQTENSTSSTETSTIDSNIPVGDIK